MKLRFLYNVFISTAKVITMGGITHGRVYARNWDMHGQRYAVDWNAGKCFRGSCYDLFQGRPTAELLQLQN